MSAAAQLALPEMLAERHNIQPQIMQRIKTNLAALDTELGAQSLCHRLEFEGGWYAVLRVPVLGSDEDLAIALLRETGVLLQPGHFFNFPERRIPRCQPDYLLSKTFAEGISRASTISSPRRLISRSYPSNVTRREPSGPKCPFWDCQTV